MSDNWEIKIGPEFSDHCLVQTFAPQDDLFDRWTELKFQFKITKDGGHQFSQIQLMPHGMIYVKERWYHRAVNFLYRLYKKKS